VSATALVVAAGSSTRMGFDKLWADLDGEPVILRTLRALRAARSIEAIVIVTRADLVDRVAALDDGLRVCVGGARRQDSVRAGLALVETEIVAVHDAARPLVDPALVDEGARLAREHGAAVAAVPATDTVKRVDAERRVVDTPPRDELWLVQTPQVFRTALLRDAHASVTDDVTDDAAMVERLGHPVLLYPGSCRNLKVTTPDDLVVARALFRG
jgi:2-C-methyl-D-erythritol 4-phosphate cytidylyltransferase